MMHTDAGRDSLAARAGRAFAAYRDGESRRMDELVDLLTPILWHTARAQGLDPATAQDVVQTAWLRLVEGSARISDPQAVMGWLLVTVRRESWRVAKQAGRTSDQVDEDLVDDAPGPAAEAVLSERQRVLWGHFGALTPKCQSLLRVIAFADKPDYAAVSEALNMPVGSIGPTRGRCLAKLREALLSDTTWGGVA
jgi:RNA polymerase sigma factor (sigma-70 family)